MTEYSIALKRFTMLKLVDFFLLNPCGTWNPITIVSSSSGNVKDVHTGSLVYNVWFFQGADVSLMSSAWLLHHLVGHRASLKMLNSSYRITG